MRPEEFSVNSPGRLEKASFREVRPGGTYKETHGWAFVPNPLPPDIERATIILDAHDHLIRAERALSLLEGVASQIENPALLTNTLMQREARLSSAIENTFASAQEMALFELDPLSLKDRNPDEVREVNNYFRALQHGFHSKLPICQRLVLEMHEILLSGLVRKAGNVGKFRNTQNAIGRAGASFDSAKFVPPPPQFVQSSLANWEKYVNTESPIPRLIRFAIAHYQFETIHPFDDGNGRIGRLLISLQLADQAQLSKPFVYVSGYFEKNRSDYYDLLNEVSTKGNWTRWILFFLEAVATQADDTATRATQLTKLRESFHARVREKRASALLPRVVDELFWYPALTVARVKELTGLTPAPAGALVQRLVQKKILIEATGRRSHRVFVAPEILQIIDA